MQIFNSMKLFFIKNIQTFILTLLFILVSIFTSFAQQSSESSQLLRGQVTDSLGGVITGVTVTATDAKGIEQTTVTDRQGQYVFALLTPGRYTIRINVPGFSSYE